VAKQAVAVWPFLPHEAMPYIDEAVRVFGQRVLAPEEESAALDNQVAVGRQLLHLLFGTRDAGQELPRALADLVADPDRKPARAALTHHVDALSWPVSRTTASRPPWLSRRRRARQALDVGSGTIMVALAGRLALER
jgi:hypothetical protein